MYYTILMGFVGGEYFLPIWKEDEGKLSYFVPTSIFLDIIGKVYLP